MNISRCALSRVVRRKETLVQTTLTKSIKKCNPHVVSPSFSHYRSLATQATATITSTNINDSGRNYIFKSSLLFATMTAVATSIAVFNIDEQKTTTAMEQKMVVMNGENAEKEDEEDETTHLLNWSGTHEVNLSSKLFHEPETMQELEEIVNDCYKNKIPIRPLGSALSPNAVGFSQKGMISMANLDRVIKVDLENQTVTCEAGARVSQVIEELRKYNLTLPNLASIAEQQMGGFIQVGAHGTGANISPVDEYVESLTLITPSSEKKITLTKNDPYDNKRNPRLFDLAKVGLGSLGIVSEVTMKCIPAHNLVEHTYVLTRQEAKDQIQTLLKKHKHIRYMWIPHQDAVVVVTNDPENDPQNYPAGIENAENMRKHVSVYDKKKQFEPLTNLLRELQKKHHTVVKDDEIDGMGFGELRDALLSFDPLSVEHAALCNEAEAKFWKRSEGYQIQPSDKLLQFDCGGQQWVFEVCFPTGSVTKDNGNDMLFMENLLAGIENGTTQIPAHSPIEQRWSLASSSCMSPATVNASDCNSDEKKQNGLHCWVGIIMYLPSEDEIQRREITHAFKTTYCDLVRSKEVGGNVGATSHWAKLEMPQTNKHLVEVQRLLKKKHPVDDFNKARKRLDPHNLLSNDLINTVFGDHTADQ